MGSGFPMYRTTAGRMTARPSTMLGPMPDGPVRRSGQRWTGPRFRPDSGHSFRPWHRTVRRGLSPIEVINTTYHNVD